jgi:tripartite ATP-independent transporter DctM subunit
MEYIPIAILLVLLLLGVPVAYSLTVAGILGITMVSDWSAAFSMMALIPHRIIATYVLISIPMFLFFGYIAEQTGIITGTFDAARRWMGRLPAGLGIATTSAAGVFAAASGSSISSCVIFGSLAVPEMRKAGYSKSISLGTVTSAGLLASTIPPSLTLILYGMLAETSIIKLFTAGILPGLLQMLVIMLTLLVLFVLSRDEFPSGKDVLPSSWREKFLSLVGVWPLLAVAVAILASIYLGVATVTESAAAGVVVTLIIVTAQRKLNTALLWNAARKTAETTAMILLILVGGLVFSTYIAMTSIADEAVNLVSALPLSATGVLLMLIPVFLILGCLLDGASILVLTIPLLLPIAAYYKIDLILLGIYLTFCIELGALTPPVGMNVFAVKGAVPDASLAEIFRSVVPFFLSLTALLVVIVLVPEIVTWLPDMLKQK